MKLGFIGAGEMGGAIIRGLLAQGWPKEDILGSVHTPESAERITKELGIEAVTDNLRVIREAGWLFVAVKPAQVESVLNEIAASGVPAKPLISMALGWTVEKIQRILPAWPVIRIMPNTPVSVGEGMIFWCAGAGVDDAARESFARIMSKAGRLSELPEGLIDAAGALSGCGPAFVDLFIEALADGGVRCGLPRDKALLLAAQTTLGAAKLVLEDGRHPGELKDAVCSPGGTTIEGVRVLEEGAFRAATMDAVIAAYEKTLSLKSK